MDLLGRLLAGEDYGPTSDFWFKPVGSWTTAGVRLDAEGAKNISAWFRGRDILATTLAMLPLECFQKLEDGSREDAPQYYLHDVLKRKPNPWQDSFGLRRQAMYQLIDTGNAVCTIVSGSRGFVSELRPFPSSCVRKVELSERGTKRFFVQDPTTRQQYTATQDDIFHLHINSEDGLWGRGILEYARNSLGLNLVMEQFAGRIFSKGSLSAGALEVPGVLKDDVAKRMAESFARSSDQWHLPKVLEQGAKWVPGQGMTPEDAQMLLSRRFGINEIARWLGIPPHMLADLERSTNNNIEHQGQEFIDYSMGPWLSLWEFGINDQLVSRPDKFYAEFNRNALVRGDIATRWAAYVDAITTGTYTRNEVRVLENKKKLPGLDEPLDPAHLTGKPSASGSRKSGDKPAKGEPDDDQTQAIILESASRVLRKEVKAMQRLAVKHAADQDAFAEAVTEFYVAHVELVQQTLQMAKTDAEAYCAGQAAQVLGPQGIRAVEAWDTDHFARGLVALALEAAA